MKNLQLSLKGKWFEMTDCDNKSEDYRDITPYWWARLVYQQEKVCSYLGITELPINEYCLTRIIKNKTTINMIAFNQFTYNIMTLGYPKSTDASRIKIFEHKGIEIGCGKEEWGAEPNKLYFIIKHGKRLQ